MSGWAGLAIVAGAYVLGSIPWSYLIVKLVKGRDVRTVGSGNAGATNVMRAAGKAAGAAALLLDCGKGVAAVAGARALGAPGLVVGGAAAAVVAGHVFPIFLGFRGGKGVATAAGVLGALEPVVLAACLVLFVLVVAWKRTVSLGSIAGAAAFPLLLLAGERLGWLRPHGPGPVAAAFLIAALVVIRHAANLDRLRRGVEPRLGERRSPAAPVPPAEDRGR
ncbi:MAG: glycerol-3-phosphate 1-O-acyltransferase PlsY [Acidobacteria bacterium]|nr:glycerol-3-phosphate 1-O-acyltransferase PlsY [Acidobacteriota bacterium]